MCHTYHVTPIRISFQPGQPIVDQVVFAAIRVFVSGQMGPGDAFPSVRVLAADLKIHPNTALKVIQHLVREGWLEVHPGIGTVVAKRPRPRDDERRRLLDEELDRLVVEAKSKGVSLEELQEAIAQRWRAIGDKEGE